MNTDGYVIVSPARNEEQHLQQTIDSVASQTLRPRKWIIVNDGSSDHTGRIIEAAAKQHSWIKPVHRPDRGYRNNFGGEVQAFYDGYQLIKTDDWKYITKLDCDLSFASEYFERLINRFSCDPRLGIASGVYLEECRSGWRQVKMPAHHAAGACKVVRRECFEQVGGFIAERGWDTIDEIRAMTKGWKTAHFSDLQMKHLKPEGSGNAWLRTQIRQGEVFYLTGGSKLFLVLKVCNRLLHRPLLLGGAAMLWGYLELMVRRQAILVTREEAEFYRALLHGRILSRVKGMFQKAQ